MRHLVIGQRQKAPNFSAFHWSPHGCLIPVGQHFVTTRVVHLPKRTETSLFTESNQSRAITSYCSYARSAQPGPIRTTLCGPCIAAKAGYKYLSRLVNELISVCRHDVSMSIAYILSGEHMTLTEIDATLLCRIDFSTTSLRRHVSAGFSA